MTTRRRCYELAHEFLAAGGEGLGEFLFEFELQVLRELIESEPETWQLLAEAMGDEEAQR